jgi:predicted DNA binding CopG/RHH family protein
MTKKAVIKDKDIIKTGEVELSPALHAEVQKRIKQADKEIEKRLTERIQIRLSRAELIRCKKKAEELGIPYTTYIRSILKQVLDKAA